MLVAWYSFTGAVKGVVIQQVEVLPEEFFRLLTKGLSLKPQLVPLLAW